ncbi:MAG: hypothetical protein KDK33_15440, partial [Leptospiraceae bacterium]|nr:hypothetical protein [Leptospiraceae bacterium]
SSSGTHTFTNTYLSGSSYNVSIQSIPAGYTCSISNNSGTFTDNVSNVRVDCLRLVTISPADSTFLGVSQPIVLTFTKPMTGCAVDTTATPAASNFGSDVGSAVLSTTNTTNDTLTLTPTTTWSNGAGRFIQLVNCQTVDGTVPAISIRIQYFVGSNAAYVSPTGADVGACGSIATACLTINYAITRLQSLGTCAGSQDCAVLVANGTYTLTGTSITLSNGISLQGSYATDFSSRFPSQRSSVITGTGGACSVGQCLVVSPLGVAATTAFSGFTVMGDQSGGANTGGMEVSGGLSITNNRIDGGNGTLNRSALNITGVGAVAIANNRIEVSGNGAANAAALNITGGAVEVYLNQILTNGATTAAQALVMTGGSGSIYTNGIGNTGTAPTMLGFTIQATGNYRIYNNMIFSGDTSTPGGTAVALQLGALFTGDIFNNFIIGSSTSSTGICIQENLAIPAVVDLVSNDVLGCSTALLEDAGGVQYTSICSAVGTPAAIGNFGTPGCAALYGNAGLKNNMSIDPLFANSASGDFHYTASSPCTVAQGGVDPTTYGVIVIWPDGDFTARPGADGFYSIGIYEPQLGCL